MQYQKSNEQEGFGNQQQLLPKKVLYSQKAGVFAKNKHNFRFIWIFVIAALSTGCILNLAWGFWYQKNQKSIYENTEYEFIYNQSQINYPLYFRLLKATIAFDFILLGACVIIFLTHVILISKLGRLFYLCISFVFFTIVTLRIMMSVLFYLDPNETFVQDNYIYLAKSTIMPDPLPTVVVYNLRSIYGWRRQYQWTWAAFGLIASFGFYSFFLLVAGYNELVYNWRKKEIEKVNQ